MTNRNPLQRYNDARSAHDTLSAMLDAGVMDWEHANPMPDMSAPAPVVSRWMDAYDTAAKDIAADLGMDDARSALVAAEHGLIGWMAVEVADQVNNHTEAAEIHRLFDMMNRHPNAATRNRVRSRLRDIALRFARGRLRG